MKSGKHISNLYYAENIFYLWELPWYLKHFLIGSRIFDDHILLPGNQLF